MNSTTNHNATHSHNPPRWLIIIATLVILITAIIALTLWLLYDPTTTMTQRIPDEKNIYLASTATTGSPEQGQLVPGTGTPSDITGQWPQFRGTNRLGWVDQPQNFATSFLPTGPTTIWSINVGEGYAGPVVKNGRVYIIDYDRQNNSDALRCLSLDDGKEIWRFTYPIKVKRNHGMSRTVPAVTDKYVVAIGPKCHVVCCDATTGQLKWYKDLVKDFGSEVPDWYAGQCPIIDNNRAIIAPAGSDILIMALDCETGDIIWQTPNPNRWKMTHSSIALMNFAGHRAYIYCASKGVIAVNTDNGSPLWQTTQWKVPIATICTPLTFDDGRIFFSDGYGIGAAMFQLKLDDNDNITPEELYRLKPKDFGTTQQTAIFYKDYIYAIRPSGELVCLNLSGKILWNSGKDHRFGLGPIMIANDTIFALNDNGLLTLAQATPSAFNLLTQAKVLDGHEAWAPMALVGTRLIVRDFTTMKCLDISPN